MAKGNYLKLKTFYPYLVSEMCRICKVVLTTLAKSKDALPRVRRNSCNSGHFIMTIFTFSDVTRDIFKCKKRSFSSWPLETELKKS